MADIDLHGVRIHVFGEIVITIDGVPVPAGPPKQRTLLALLLCRPGLELPSDELVEALWSSRAPSSARNNLRTYVHGLRRILGEELISGNGRPGYRLHADRVWIDTDRFAELLATAQRALGRDDAEAAREALAEAVALRRGPAFGDAAQLEPIEAEAARLEERWLLAVEQRIGLDQARGAAAELVGELTSLVKRHPFRERFVALLMLALYRSGRQTDALAVYRGTATALDEELGVEPGPPLAELHQAMLRQDPRLDLPTPVAETTGAAEAPPVARPAELPSGSGHFTGRAEQGAALDEALEAARRVGRLPVLAVVGPAGSGKTALVVDWARRHSEDFPDGQIFADLRGFSATEPVTGTAEALRRLLWSLGVEADRVPGTVDEAGALLRSLLAGKRLLMVLDNVVSPAQVAPLLPGGDGNAVVVTSRNRLSGLIARHGAQQIPLAALTDHEAFALLERIVGSGRVHAEAGAARELAQRCGRWPLALCIAAANVAEDPEQSLAGYLTRHRAGAWVDTLGTAGDPDQTVMAAFDLSLRCLTAAQQRLLVLLSLVPGPTFTADAAAALTGGSHADLGTDLLRLVNAHFVQRTTGARFAFHDLIQQYARGKAATIGAGDRDAALHRLYDFYADTADAADRVLQPGALRLPGRAPVVPDPFGGDVRAARAWFTDELATLVAACREAGAHGDGPAAIRLADAVGRHLWTQVDLDTWTTVAQAGERAAVAAGDLHGRAAAQIALARIADGRCDFTTGVARYQDAVRLAREARWPEAQEVALGSIAALHGQLGDLGAAVEQLEAALAISRERGDRLHEGRTLQLLGAYRAEQGELKTAADLFRQALAVVEEQGSRIGQAIILTNTAGLDLLRGEYGEAARQAGRALRITEEVDHVSCRISALVNLSAAWRGLGMPGTALPYVRQALAIPAGLDARDLGFVLHEAAEVHDALGERERAIEYHRTAYRMAAGAQTRSLALSHAIALALAEHRWSQAGFVATPTPAVPDLRACLAEARRYGFRGLEGAALGALAEVSRDRGLTDAAIMYAGQALRLQREAGWYTDAALLTAIAAGHDD
ncbi:AfsR/SARP family transcriptional regulator [Actinoplanes sp. NPDC051494]|uniref:AfsR/SARP family transcriptional regulator n=1 Tax=Actinoplanes sp. NPDC051494 TaxID=3363907 RepID=UPI003797A4B1